MNHTKKIVYVNYFDEINSVKAKSIMAILTEIINREKPDTIYFMLSSTGGLVDAGIALYNYIRALPVEIIMHNTGSIDSIANCVFLAADTRYASVHSSFLFHGINWTFLANTPVFKNQLSETLSSISAMESKISGIISARTKLTTAEIMELFSQGESKYADFALEKEIVSKIQDPKIPKDALIISLNLP